MEQLASDTPLTGPLSYMSFKESSSRYQIPVRICKCSPVASKPFLFIIALELTFEILKSKTIVFTNPYINRKPVLNKFHAYVDYMTCELSLLLLGIL